MKKYNIYLPKSYILIITFFSIALTQVVQKGISFHYFMVKSGNPFLVDFLSYPNSILNYLFTLFDQLNFNSSSITIFISFLYSLIALSMLIIFGICFKKMSCVNLCILICFLFFLEKLGLFLNGFTYPLAIVIPTKWTGGLIGMGCALLTISVFLNNYKHGFIAAIFNLFIHPTIGLLTLSYLFLSSLLKKNYLNALYLSIICLIYLLINYDSSFSSNENLIKFIHENDHHRKPLEIQHFKFLPLALLLTLLHSKKRELIVEWVFMTICVFISFIYYNIQINFLELPFLSLMPSRGANIAIAMIIIKSCADLIINPKFYKIICVIFYSILHKIIFAVFTHLTTILIGCITGLIVISITTAFKIELKPINRLGQKIKVKKEYFVMLLLSFIIYLNSLSFSNNISGNSDYPVMSYDNFFNSLNDKAYCINLVGDFGIMARNQNIVTLMVLSMINGFSYNPKNFEKWNQIFKVLFKENLWEIDTDNIPWVNYKFRGPILEKHRKEDWHKIRKLNLKYILCPSSSKINLKRPWENNEYVIFEL